MKPILGYVDPGTGLLMWQAIVSVGVGLLFYLKKSRDWLLASFSRLLRIGTRTPPGPVSSLNPAERAQQVKSPTRESGQ